MTITINTTILIPKSSVLVRNTEPTMASHNMQSANSHKADVVAAHGVIAAE
jgi:hypothetical protein